MLFNYAQRVNIINFLEQYICIGDHNVIRLLLPDRVLALSFVPLLVTGKPVQRPVFLVQFKLFNGSMPTTFLTKRSNENDYPE